MLTLRRRFSGLRRGTRPVVDEGHEFVQSRSIPNFGIPEETGNPWDESSSSAEEGLLGRRRPSASTLHHRLSFDPASGVIMLPDNGDWLMDDTEHSSDDEDIYGADNPAPARSTAESVFNEDLDSNGANTSMTLMPTSSVSPSKSSRYVTYYHHPERRKQQIPGAFPER